MNDKNENGENSFLCGCNRNDIEIVKLLNDYAIKNSIILKLNEKDNNGNYSFLWAC